MVPFTVRLLKLVWIEVPEVKSQVCENLSKYLQKSGSYSVSRNSLAHNISMLEQCTKTHLMHTTLDNFVDVTRLEIFSLRELCFAIIQHIHNAIANRKTPSNVYKSQMQVPPLSYRESTLCSYTGVQDRTQKIANGWQHSLNKNRLYPNSIATFSEADAAYPHAMATPRWNSNDIH